MNQGRFLLVNLWLTEDLCNWTKTETFSNVFQKYVDKCRHLRINILVFDGHASSRKDATRSAKMSQVVAILEYNRCRLIKQNSKLAMSTSLVDCLGKKWEEHSFQVVYCLSDAGTAIINQSVMCYA